jgi:hypothetical protein
MRLVLLVPAALALAGCGRTTVNTAHAMAADAQRLADACTAADWHRALDTADQVRADEAHVRGTVSAPGLFGMVDDALPLTESAAGRRARRSCEGGAAAVTLAASKLDADDTEELVGWLWRLDADAQYHDYDAAGRDVVKADDAWGRVRPHVDGETAATVDAALASVHGSVLEWGWRPMRHAAHAALDALRGARTR